MKKIKSGKKTGWARERLGKIKKRVLGFLKKVNPAP